MPRHSWLSCLGVCVFVCALRLYSATPGWVVRWGCVCLGSGCCRAPLLLAGLLGCVCVCLRAQLVLRHSRLGCAMWACVPGLGFRLRPATPGRVVWVCVCLCARSACTLPLQVGVRGMGVCAWAWVSAAPRQSRLGSWGVCVFGCALCLYPAAPGWGVPCGRVCLGSGFGWDVWVCVCLCARYACTLPLQARVCGVGVCAWARVAAAPRHSWVGCWGVSVFVCALRLYPATPGWRVRCGCVCLGSGLGCGPPTPSWGVGVCVIFVCALRLYPATPSWGARYGRVCLGLGFGCAPPLLAGVLGCVCVCLHALLVPRHSWLGCAMSVCVLGPGLGCAPPLLVGVFWCACVCVCAPLVPRHSRLGCAMWACVLKPVRTPVAIIGSLGVCIYVPASRHWLISYSPIHLT